MNIKIQQFNPLLRLAWRGDATKVCSLCQLSVVISTPRCKLVVARTYIHIYMSDSQPTYMGMCISTFSFPYIIYRHRCKCTHHSVGLSYFDIYVHFSNLVTHTCTYTHMRYMWHKLLHFYLFHSASHLKPTPRLLPCSIVHAYVFMCVDTSINVIKIMRKCVLYWRCH